MTVRQYFVQRLTALLLAPLVIVHLLLIIYAVRGGLSAAEILARTQNSIVWLLFYSLFVICAALHGSIGLRVILLEWTAASAKIASIISHTVMFILLLLGLRAVYAVTFA